MVRSLARFRIDAAGSSFWRRSDGVSAIATVICLSRSTSPPICLCRSSPAATTPWPVARQGNAFMWQHHDVAVVLQRREEVHVDVREYRLQAVLVFEQVERAGHAVLGEDRRLHAILRHQRIGHRFRCRNLAMTHGQRRRRARADSANACASWWR